MLYILHIIFVFLYIDDNNIKPECILRIEKLTNKKIVFIQCDITNLNELRDIFKKV